MESSKNFERVILFDGVCNLCNGAVQKVIENDRKNLFKFASLQSDFGQNFLKKNNLNDKDFNTIILLEDNRYFIKSEAALRIGKELNGIYRLSGWFLWIPKFIRDGVYDIVSKNRYKWFGKQENCWIPTPELKEKFLD